MNAEHPAPPSAAIAAPRFMPFPNHGDFDYRLHAAQASAFGIPPQPPDTAPLALRDFWSRLFGRPLRLQPFAATEPVLEELEVAHIAALEVIPITTPGHAEDSQNWAGAYITANHGKHLGTMFGVWQVPLAMHIPAGAAPADYACSIWMGLDGQRLYFDSSLPQIGTLVRFADDGTRQDTAWVQWWQRGNPQNSFQTLNLVVNPGDLIGCFMHVTSPGEVHFVIVNLDLQPTGLAFSLPAPVGDGSPVVFGATAEWVLERPTKLGQTTMYNLPNFEQCQMAGLALQTGQIGGALFDGDLRDLTSARMLRMYEHLAGPSRTALIALPHRAGPFGVEIDYGGF